MRKSVHVRRDAIECSPQHLVNACSRWRLVRVDTTAKQLTHCASVDMNYRGNSGGTHASLHVQQRRIQDRRAMKHAPFIFHLRGPYWPRLSIRRASARGVKLRETGGIKTTPFLAGRLAVGRRKLLCDLGRVRQRGAVVGSIWPRGQRINVCPWLRVQGWDGLCNNLNLRFWSC
jgi:hypothetical protein